MQIKEFIKAGGKKNTKSFQDYNESKISVIRFET